MGKERKEEETRKKMRYRKTMNSKYVYRIIECGPASREINDHANQALMQ